MSQAATSLEKRFAPFLLNDSSSRRHNDETTTTMSMRIASCPATEALESLIRRESKNNDNEQPPATTFTRRQQQQQPLSPPFFESNDDDTFPFSTTTTRMKGKMFDPDFQPVTFPLIRWYAGNYKAVEMDQRDDPASTSMTTKSPSTVELDEDDDVQTNHDATTIPTATPTSSTADGTTTDSASAGKRAHGSGNNRRMSKTRLVRSIALNSHLSLLEASIEPLQDSVYRKSGHTSTSTTSTATKTTSSSLSSSSSSSGNASYSSTNSFSAAFDVEKWLEIADHSEATEIFASPTKMRKTMQRQPSINTSMHGLALIT